MRTERTLNLQTDLSWQTRINFTCVCITAFTISNVFFGPADLLLLYYQHPSVCTGPPVVPVYIQSSPPHTRHTMDFCTDYVLDLWGLFVILGTVFRLSWKPPVRSSSSIHMGDNTVNFCNCIPSLKSSTWVKLHFADLCDLSVSEKLFNLQEVNHSKCCVWEKTFKMDLRYFYF